MACEASRARTRRIGLVTKTACGTATPPIIKALCVWPWLIGPFITAYLRANGGTKRARERAYELLAPLHGHLSDAGLGHVSEILDSESPHEPRGWIAQAWSVAEILRAAVEDVVGVKPARRQSSAVRPAAR